MEIRIHGRGGQGGVTGAKLLAAVYAQLGKSVQAFGDYAGERSGAPVRAYVRTADAPITNRNKVYRPDHVLVLDESLLDAQAVAGLAPGGLLLVNTLERPEAFTARFPSWRVATVDATAIARRHGIGTRSLVIVNTTIAGAFARALELPWFALADAYQKLGKVRDLTAAQEAWDAVRLGPAPGAEALRAAAVAPSATAPPAQRPPVLDLVEHRTGAAPRVTTGSWRTQTPVYTQHVSPCNAVCPAGNDVEGFVQALARRDAEEAAAILGRTTPLAGVCGRVCPAPCMQGCSRRTLDGAVQVRSLERWVADRVRVTQPGTASAATARRIAVVGGGPAGLAAAYALRRLGHLPTIYEAAPELGGLLRYGIPEYRLPRAVLAAEVEALLQLGVEARCGTRLAGTALEELLAGHDGIVLATGQQRRTVADVPGAARDGVVQGLAFLAGETAGEAEVAGRHVVVLGGGNSAIDCARSALRRGADRVTIAYRRRREDMPAIPEEVEEAEEEGVELLLQRAPVAFLGNGKVTAVELAEVTMGEPDASGRRRPVVGEGRQRLACDVVLLALGQSAEPAVLPAGWQLAQRAVRGDGGALPVVTAGDLVSNEGTVAHAIGDGRRAALQLLATLGEPVAIGDGPGASPGLAPRAVEQQRIRLHAFAPRTPDHPLRRPAARRRHDTAEVTQGLANASEADRCLACGDCTHCDRCLITCPDGVIHRDGAGGYRIDYDQCKGCGLCVAECPRDGMEMLAIHVGA